MGGSPADATSYEWICYCDSCGAEMDDDNRDELCLTEAEIKEINDEADALINETDHAPSAQQLYGVTK